MRSARKVIAGLGLAGALSVALLTAGCQKATDAVFDARVHSYLLKHPEVIEEAVNQLNANKDKDAADKARQAIATRKQAIEHDPRDFVANPNGKITVTEFYDYNCTYCKGAAPQIIDLVRKNPDVRFVFKEFPIFGGDSDRAASLALAAKDKGNYLTLYQQFYAAAPHLDQATMEQIITADGLDKTALEHAAVSDDVKKHLVDNHDLATAIGINGTPSFVVNGALLAGADINALNRAISEARQRS